MILKLRNGKILIENNTVPSDVHNTIVCYDYELGTNHYKTLLYIEDKVYEGSAVNTQIDYNKPQIEFKVELIDTHNRVVRKYTGTYIYLKLCLIGTSEITDIYKQLELLYNENVKLKEQGEVI